MLFLEACYFSVKITDLISSIGSQVSNLLSKAFDLVVECQYFLIKLYFLLFGFSTHIFESIFKFCNFLFQLITFTILFLELALKVTLIALHLSLKSLNFNL